MAREGFSTTTDPRRNEKEKKRSKSLSALPVPRRTRRTNQKQVAQQDIIIAVMGPTGAGKSSFINALLGSEAATVGHDLASRTEDIQVYKTLHPDGSGRHVVLVDTPGFDDTKLSDAEILKRIGSWLSSSYRKGNILTGLLFLHRISNNRMAGTPSRNLTMFRKLVGHDALDNVMLVTTMWDELQNEEEGKRREEELRQKFWKPMVAAGSLVSRFQRHPSSPAQTKEAAWNIIDQLPGVAKAVRLQEELVDQGLSLAQTDAGSTLFGWLMNKIRHFREVIRRLEARLRGGETALGIVHEIDVAEDRLEQVEEQVHVLMDAGAGPSRPVPLSIAIARTTDDRASLQLPSASTSSTSGEESESNRRVKLAKTIVLLTNAVCIAEASPIPFLKGAVHLALTIAQLIEGMAVVEDSSVKLAQNIADLVLAITSQSKRGPVSEDLNRAIRNLFRELEDIRDSVKKGISTTAAGRFFNQKADDDWVRDGRQKFRNACNRFEIVAALINNQAISRIERQLALALSGSSTPAH